MRPLSTFLTPTVIRADFNRDGVQDLALAIPGIPGKVSLLLANGDGSFRFGFEFEAGDAAALEAGDFNNDGIQDLVTPGLIFLGNGNGTFQPALNITGVDSISAIVSGFINSDGFLDLVVASRATRTVSVLLGNGNGTFRAPLSFDTGAPVRFSEKRSVALGDFNRDGSLDLVVTNASAGSISLLAGNGDGTFRTPLLFDTGSDPLSLAVADFDGDQIPDIAVATSSLGIAVLLGNGNGTVRTPRSVGQTRGEAVVRGDFNGDGIPDLAVTGSSLPGTAVLLGNGDGTFQPAVTLETTNGSSLIVGDFSGDGRPDLAVVGNLDAFFFRINTLSVLINNTRDPRLTLEPLELTTTDDRRAVTSLSWGVGTSKTRP